MFIDILCYFFLSLLKFTSKNYNIANSLFIDRLYIKALNYFEMSNNN